MTNFYVRSTDGNDLDNGTTWALATATIAAGIALCTADGDIVYIADGHSEANADKNWNCAFNIRVIGVDDTGDPEPPTAKASSRVSVFSGMTNNDHLSISTDKSTIHFERLHFRASSFLLHTTYDGGNLIFEDCHLEFVATSNTRNLVVNGADDGHTYLLLNTDLTCGGANTHIDFATGGVFIWRGGVLAGNPTYLSSGSNRGGILRISDVDLSSLTTTIMNYGLAGHNECKVIGSKLGSGVTLFNGIGEANDVGIMRGCHTADGYYAFHEETYAGIASEETAIYRAAGATYDGTNEFSVDMTTNANAAPYKEPLRFKLAEIFIDTADYTTNVNFKVHLARDASAVAYDDEDFWLEIVHPDGADNALKNLVTTKNAPLTTVTALTTETGLWTGLGGTNKQMSVSKAIAIGASAGNIASGVVEIYACFAAASDTAFVCPDPVIS